MKYTQITHIVFELLFNEGLQGHCESQLHGYVDKIISACLWALHTRGSYYHGNRSKGGMNHVLKHYRGVRGIEQKIVMVGRGDQVMDAYNL